MKKRNPAILLLSIIFSLSITIMAYAAGTQYKISDINVILTVPEGLYSLTRNVSEGNIAVEILDAKPEELYALYQHKGIYLNAFPEDLSYEIILVASKTDEDDFMAMTDDELKEFENSLIKEYETMENEALLSVSQYTGNGTDYIVTSSYYKDNYVSSYAIKYSTVKNNTNYSYILQTNDTELSDEHISILNSLIDSAEYTYVRSSVTESPIFTTIMEKLIGGGLTIVILSAILFLLTRSTKKR